MDNRYGGTVHWIQSLSKGGCRFRIGIRPYIAQTVAQRDRISVPVSYIAQTVAQRDRISVPVSCVADIPLYILFQI